MNKSIHIHNKTRHSYIYVPYSWPNGWTDWAEFFCGHSWMAGGLYRLKKFENYFSKFFFLENLFFHGQRRALQLVGYKIHGSLII